MVKSPGNSQDLSDEPFRGPKIWLYMPHFGAVPNYFQLYLDSVERNLEYLRILFISDVDLSGYRLPCNFFLIQSTMEEQRQRASRFLLDRLRIEVDAEDLLQGPYKFCDFRVIFPTLFDDIGLQFGLRETDFVGWGDCDVIYGLFGDFFDDLAKYDVIGGYHGHFTALRNSEPFRDLYRRVPDLPALLLSSKNHLADEVAFRGPMLELLERTGGQMFYMNRYFCDIVPDVFLHLYRDRRSGASSDFFDLYNPDRDVAYVACDKDGRLTVHYEDGQAREAIYCHLQKRQLSIQVNQWCDGFVVQRDAFRKQPVTNRATSPTVMLCPRVGPHAEYKGSEMEQVSQDVAVYLEGDPPFRLELGAGPNSKIGWLGTDLVARTSPNGTPIVSLDATKPFPIPNNSFDYIYSEHMIEHLSLDGGLNMLGECHRILRPGGVLRIVTPSLGFLLKIVSPDRTPLENRYRDWSVTWTIADPPAVTNAVFLNNFVRAWGHQFIYDYETLRLALEFVGFREIEPMEINVSSHAELRNLECEERIPPGFLALESMVVEAVKREGEGKSGVTGRNLALGCRADQSSISPWSMAETAEADAARVVSGKWTGSYNNHTGLDPSPWWYVDLGRPARIEQVNIYNRKGNLAIMRRLNHFEIQLSDDARTWRSVFRKEDETVVHSHPMMPYIWRPDASVTGRYVRIQLLQDTYLHLEQVEVFGFLAV